LERETAVQIVQAEQVTADRGHEGRAAHTTSNQNSLKSSATAMHHPENQRCVAENDGQENKHESGQLMAAQLTRQMRVEQLPRPFHNKFCHSFKLLSFQANPECPITNHASPSRPHTKHDHEQ
jgi:hypothetical protein